MITVTGAGTGAIPLLPGGSAGEWAQPHDGRYLRTGENRMPVGGQGSVEASANSPRSTRVEPMLVQEAINRSGIAAVPVSGVNEQPPSWRRCVTQWGTGTYCRGRLDG